MVRLGVVIPTRFSRPSLADLIASASQVATVVLVHTEPGHDDVPGTLTLRDYRRNIHHWWNTGLDVCTGPALVLNDDLRATPEALGQLLAALSDADLVYVPGRPAKAAVPISGWCYGLDPDRLRPDPAFTWWHGDNDLYRRAERDGLRIRRVDVEIEHIDRGGFGKPPEFAEAVKADAALYRERWG